MLLKVTIIMCQSHNILVAINYPQKGQPSAAFGRRFHTRKLCTCMRTDDATHDFEVTCKTAFTVAITREKTLQFTNCNAENEAIIIEAL